MTRITVKQLKEEVEELKTEIFRLKVEVENLKRKNKYDWYENGIPQKRKCPCCGKTEPYQPYPYTRYCEEY